MYTVFVLIYTLYIWYAYISKVFLYISIYFYSTYIFCICLYISRDTDTLAHTTHTWSTYSAGTCEAVRGLQLLTWDGLHHGGEILQRCRACGHQPPAWKMLGKCVRPLKAWHFPVHGVALTSSTASTLRPALDWSCVLHRFASGD